MSGRCFARPQDGDSGLDAEAHRVRIAGAITQLTYPPLCPFCGGAASEQVPVSKVFLTHADQPERITSHYAITSAWPLFCPACADRHREETIAPTPLDTALTFVLSENAIPGVVTMIGGLLVLNLIPRAQGDGPFVMILLAVAAVMLLVSLWCWRIAWTNTDWKRVPAQTNTSRAFDFGYDPAFKLQAPERTYAFRNADYATAFAEANATLHAHWTSPKQKARERRNLWIIIAVVAALAIAGMFVR